MKMIRAIIRPEKEAEAGHFVGQELDLQTSYTVPRQVQIAGGFGHIFPGTFLKNATRGVSYNFPYTQVTYTF